MLLPRCSHLCRCYSASITIPTTHITTRSVITRVATARMKSLLALIVATIITLYLAIITPIISTRRIVATPELHTPWRLCCCLWWWIISRANRLSKSTPPRCNGATWISRCPMLRISRRRDYAHLPHWLNYLGER